MAVRRFAELAPRFAPVLGFAVVVAASRCGDPQLGASYRGEPIWTLSGQTTISGSSLDTTQKLRMALFFSPEGRNVLELGRWVEHFGSAMPVQVPSLYTMNVFEPPSAEHMLRSPDGRDAGFAVARLLVYSDVNDDGLHQYEEPFVGIAPPVAFYYVRDPLPAAATGTVHNLAPGFGFALLPQPCGFVPPAPTDLETCGVPLGERCNVDGDCSGGLCLKETKMPWPAGYCVIPDPPPSGCRPARSAYMDRPSFSLTPQVAQQGLYLRACQSDAECLRVGDRDQGLYSCDRGLGACRPRLGSVLIPVGGRFEVEPFCANPP